MRVVIPVHFSGTHTAAVETKRAQSKAFEHTWLRIRLAIDSDTVRYHVRPGSAAQSPFIV